MRKPTYLALLAATGLCVVPFAVSFAGPNTNMPVKADLDRTCNRNDVPAEMRSTVKLSLSEVREAMPRKLNLESLSQRIDDLTLERIDLTYLFGEHATDVCPGDNSFRPAINGDGSSVVFTSLAQNITADNTNGVPQVYVWDYTDPTSTTTLVSKNTTTGLAGTGGSGCYEFPSSVFGGLEFLMWNNDITNDGLQIVFASTATNLVAGDTNGGADVFLYDRTGAPVVTRISTDGTGAQLAGYSFDPVIAGDGGYVAFVTSAQVSGITDSNYNPGSRRAGFDVYLKDLSTGALTLVSHVDAAPTTTGAGDSVYPAISDDGSLIAYVTSARNIDTTLAWPAPGNTNSAMLIGSGQDYTNIAVYDVAAGTNSFISVTTTGGLPASIGSCIQPHISGNGQFVTWTSNKPLHAGAPSGKNSSGYVRDITLALNNPNALRVWTSDDSGNRVMRTTATTLAGATTNDGLKTFFRVGYDTDTTQDPSANPTPGMPVSAHYDGVFVKNWATLTDSTGTTSYASGIDNGGGLFTQEERALTTYGAANTNTGSITGGAKPDAPAITSNGAYFAWTTPAGYGQFVTKGLNNIYRYEVGTANGAAEVLRVSSAAAGVESRIAMDDKVLWPAGWQRIAVSPNGQFMAFETWASNWINRDGGDTDPSDGLSPLYAWGDPFLVIIDTVNGYIDLENFDPDGYITSAYGWYFADSYTSFPFAAQSTCALRGTGLFFQGGSVTNDGQFAYLYWGEEFGEFDLAASVNATCVVVPYGVDGPENPFSLYEVVKNGDGYLDAEQGSVYFASATYQSNDGRYVAFAMPAMNLTTPNLAYAEEYRGFRWDTSNHTVLCTTLTAFGTEPNGAVILTDMSANGNVCIYSNDGSTNMAGMGDVAGQVWLSKSPFTWGASGNSFQVSTNADGSRDDSSAADVTGSQLSATGSLAVFTTDAQLGGETDLVARVFLKDVSGANPSNGALTVITPGLTTASGDDAGEAGIDSYGAEVLFVSSADFSGDATDDTAQYDLFTYNVATQARDIVTEDAGGAQDENGTPRCPATGINPALNYLAYVFAADFGDTLVPGDCSATEDIYVFYVGEEPPPVTGAQGSWNMYE